MTHALTRPRPGSRIASSRGLSPQTPAGDCRCPGGLDAGVDAPPALNDPYPATGDAGRTPSKPAHPSNGLLVGQIAVDREKQDTIVLVIAIVSIIVSGLLIYFMLWH